MTKTYAEYPVKIRKGTEADLPAAIELIIELARHEQSLHEMEVSLKQLQQDHPGAGITDVRMTNGC